VTLRAVAPEDGAEQRVSRRRLSKARKAEHVADARLPAGRVLTVDDSREGKERDVLREREDER
jgi:hypothetical protein